jgi:hypothetical protein
MFDTIGVSWIDIAALHQLLIIKGGITNGRSINWRFIGYGDRSRTIS